MSKILNQNFSVYLLGGVHFQGPMAQWPLSKVKRIDRFFGNQKWTSLQNSREQPFSNSYIAHTFQTSSNQHIHTLTYSNLILFTAPLVILWFSNNRSSSSYLILWLIWIHLRPSYQLVCVSELSIVLFPAPYSEVVQSVTNWGHTQTLSHHSSKGPVMQTYSLYSPIHPWEQHCSAFHSELEWNMSHRLQILGGRNRNAQEQFYW